MLPSANPVLSWVGAILFVGITLLAIRLLVYWRSFIFAWRRYRRRDLVSTAELRGLPVPSAKVQITTRGSLGSTEVILRGVENVMSLAAEDPEYYGRILSVELITESLEQVRLVEESFRDAPCRVSALVLPPEYETPNGTRFKARGMHYLVEQRRAGWNRTSGRTFIVHYDEESVMPPSELRKLLAVLATTEKKVLEGPIYYPLEYSQTGILCRAMEANRPVGCFECRSVMELGVPFHLHGSNLVVEEGFENDIGWDIGTLNGQPFIAEDFVFGLLALSKGGSGAFGWHGCVLLEQPPFSVRSAFKQRYRWIFGVLQGLASTGQNPQYQQLPRRLRRRISLGTRFRIATFAVGAVTALLSLFFMPLMVHLQLRTLLDGHEERNLALATAWMAVVGALWLGSIYIGAWLNVRDAGLGRAARWAEVARTIVVAPVAGLIETSAGLWAVVHWLLGRRGVSWQPTPKTKQADAEISWGAESDSVPHGESAPAARSPKGVLS